MYEYGVFIGRFQPFHNAHLKTVRFALKQAQTLIVGVGSCNQAPDTRNPWSGPERAEMILACLTPEERQRVRFAYLEDFYYNNLRWIAGVQRALADHTSGSKDIKLIGHKKDTTSFYLNLFPQWGPHLDPGFKIDIDATKVRDLMFTQDKIGIRNMLPPAVFDIVDAWMETPEFKRLHDEQHYIWEEQERWVGAKHPPHFVTVDAVCICSGHILVVRRGGKYGRGQIALPGGYLDVEETLEKSCIRELKEETAIRLPRHELAKLVVDHDVFDHPKRDLRGRVITHAFCFKLPDGELPEVKGSNDADKAWWEPLNDVNNKRARFFSDHWHIIDHFVSAHKF
jgi:bifunctional NMN adenylyltransferase/nudix hydrolase